MSHSSSAARRVRRQQASFWKESRRQEALWQEELQRREAVRQEQDLRKITMAAAELIGDEATKKTPARGDQPLAAIPSSELAAAFKRTACALVDGMGSADPNLIQTLTFWKTVNRPDKVCSTAIKWLCSDSCAQVLLLLVAHKRAAMAADQEAEEQSETCPNQGDSERDFLETPEDLLFPSYLDRTYM
jgi:hypothetical protein